jgi:copper chaperone CopZ
MIRRDFIQRVTAVAGATGLAIGETVKTVETKGVTYKVNGFSCVTCAVGLEVMLRQQKGIARVKASYPDGVVVIGFDPGLITEMAIEDFITSKGFTIGEERKS